MNNKKIAVIGGVVAALICAWLGASMYVQTKFAAEVKAASDKMSSNVGVAVKGLKQESGFLSSTGQFVISLTDASGDTDLAIDLAVNYKASHLILPTSLTRFDWVVKPAGAAAKDLERMFGDNARMEGAAKIGLNMGLSSSLAIPKLATKEDGFVFEFGPTVGSISGGKNAVAFDTTTARVIVRGADDVIDIKQLKLSTDVKDSARGLGTATLSIEEFATKDASASGIAYQVSSMQRNDRIDVKMTPSVRSATYNGVTIKDAVIELAIKDLNAKSVETLSTILNDANLTNLTAAERISVQTALRDLIYQGFSLGITKLAASAKEGILDGNISLELLKSASNKPADFSLIKALRSNGQVQLKGNPTLDPKLKGMALMFGAAVETPEGALKASYDYVDGKANFNGKTMDFASELGFAQELIMKFLSEDFLSQAASKDQAKSIANQAPTTDAPPANVAPPVQPPALAPVVPDAAPNATTNPTTNSTTTAPNSDSAVVATTEGKGAPPEAPLPTGQNCQDIGECLLASIVAAASEDIESVRAAATRIDDMPKPDLGNRAVARKLNTEGLDALKRGDNKGAVAKFKAALKENPRDVEVAGNLGFALVKISEPDDAVDVLADALILDPRRSSTWIPLGEALALAGYPDESVAALWVGYQWSSNREKSQAFFATQAEKQLSEKPALAKAYERVLLWTQGTKPDFEELGK
jgi:tetratricopeptide (TPR) repeat protein